ncbi:MAG: DUF92 domain-containing protein, partial [Promethearchaeota archaeon]
ARIVTKSGVVTAYILGICIWLLASWTWFLLMLLFFFVTAHFTHYKYQVKRRHGAAQEKGGARDWSHVLANGGLPLSFVIICFLATQIIPLLFPTAFYGYGSSEVGSIPFTFPITSIFFAAFLGALATATADTLATEIGLLNPSPPRLITKPWKVVPPGTSGGISLAGEFATVLGTLLIGGAAALLAAPFWISLTGSSLMPSLIQFAPITMLVVTVVGGITGCTVDSLFGATIQGMWRCKVCYKQTEKRKHCGESAEYLRGTKFFDNHMVNMISCLIGAFVAATLYITLLTFGIA